MGAGLEGVTGLISISEFSVDRNPVDVVEFWRPTIRDAWVISIPSRVRSFFLYWLSSSCRNFLLSDQISSKRKWPCTDECTDGTYRATIYTHCAGRKIPVCSRSIHPIGRLWYETNFLASWWRAEYSNLPYRIPVCIGKRRDFLWWWLAPDRPTRWTEQHPGSNSV